MSYKQIFNPVVVGQDSTQKATLMSFAGDA